MAVYVDEVINNTRDSPDESDDRFDNEPPPSYGAWEEDEQEGESLPPSYEDSQYGIPEDASDCSPPPSYKSRDDRQEVPVADDVAVLEEEGTHESHEKALEEWDRDLLISFQRPDAKKVPNTKVWTSDHWW